MARDRLDTAVKAQSKALDAFRQAAENLNQSNTHLDTVVSDSHAEIHELNRQIEEAQARIATAQEHQEKNARVMQKIQDLIA